MTEEQRRLVQGVGAVEAALVRIRTDATQPVDKGMDVLEDVIRERVPDGADGFRRTLLDSVATARSVAVGARLGIVESTVRKLSEQLSQ